jgi:hypothetical protein
MNGLHATTSAADLTVLERFMLVRLDRFVRVSRSAEQDGPPQWQRLARHSVFSTYRDCVELGLVSEARAIVEGSTAA